MAQRAPSVRPAFRLPIAGIEPLSTVDWPDELCAVVFTQGCGWHCRYCHNPHLIPFKPNSTIRWEQVRQWLDRRKGLLDGVVFSGGEPTHHAGLAEAMKQVVELGFRVGLHTGGPQPKVLEPLLPLLDWVGFDVKAPFDRYAKITGKDQGMNALLSLRRIREYGVAHEVRTTWHPALLTPGDLRRIAETLAELQVQEWVIQRFRPNGCEDPEIRAIPPGDPPIEQLDSFGIPITLRN